MAFRFEFHSFVSSILFVVKSVLIQSQCQLNWMFMGALVSVNLNDLFSHFVSIAFFSHSKLASIDKLNGIFLFLSARFQRELFSVVAAFQHWNVENLFAFFFFHLCLHFVNFISEWNKKFQFHRQSAVEQWRWHL